MIIKGETVTVRVLDGEGRDPLGAKVLEYRDITVDDVLIAPSETYEDEFDVNGTGYKHIYNVYFPKHFDECLNGALIVIRGEEYKVSGNPKRYTDENVPGKWNLKAKVVGYGE